MIQSHYFIIKFGSQWKNISLLKLTEAPVLYVLYTINTSPTRVKTYQWATVDIGRNKTVVNCFQMVRLIMLIKRCKALICLLAFRHIYVYICVCVCVYKFQNPNYHQCKFLKRWFIWKLKIFICCPPMHALISLTDFFGQNPLKFTTFYLHSIITEAADCDLGFRFIVCNCNINSIRSCV